MEFPTSFYGVNKYNRWILMNSNTDGLIRYALPLGNYTATDIIPVLETAMLTLSPTGGAPTVDYDTITGKFTYTYTTDDGQEFIFWQGNPPIPPTPAGMIEEDKYNASVIMGFPKWDGTLPVPAYYKFAGGVLESKNVINLNGDPLTALHVRTQLTHTNAIESLTRQYSNILQKVPVTACPFAMNFFIPGSGTGVASISQQKNVNRIYISITDDQNRLVDTNGLEFNLSILFEFIKTPEIIIPQPVIRQDERVEAQAEMMIKKYKKVRVKKEPVGRMLKDISEARKHNEDIQTEHIAGSMGDPKDLIHPQKIGKVVNLGGSRFIDPTEPTE